MFETDRLLCGSAQDTWLGINRSSTATSNYRLSSSLSKAERHAAARRAAARSKSGLWGPTHSIDSDDTSYEAKPLKCEGTDESGVYKKPWSASTLAGAPQHFWNQAQQVVGMIPTQYEQHNQDEEKTNSLSPVGDTSLNQETSVRIQRSGLNRTNLLTPIRNSSGSIVDTAGCNPNNRDITGKIPPNKSGSVGDGFCAETTLRTTSFETQKISVTKNIGFFSEVMGACSPCSAGELEELFRQQEHQKEKNCKDATPLGISRMEPPEEKKEDSVRQSSSPIRQRSIRTRDSSSEQQCTNSSPAERRRKRHMERQQRSNNVRAPLSVQEEFEVTSQRVLFNCKIPMPPIDENAKQKHACNLPCATLTVRQDDAIELERSISELTMRSSYGGVNSRTSEQRRMAYYAVGLNHRQHGRGGNRRCYFTGKLIMSNAPFYAGSVQQGLRTLVVFCLPSALGLPRGCEMRRVSSSCSKGEKSSITLNSLATSRDGSNASRFIFKDRLTWHRNKRNTSHTSGTGSSVAFSRNQSKISSVDEMSSIISDIDPNWGLDRDYLLQVLPEPGDEILVEMSKVYPEQFKTLPLQVREASCWRLYVKFCFFSGLPIAEGELHYKVKDAIANEVYGEEIVLSHDVMEAVNGSSAEILPLPNQKTFRYLQKHYTQQSGKLTDLIFRRASWELVRAEV